MYPLKAGGPEKARAVVLVQTEIRDSREAEARCADVQGQDEMGIPGQLRASGPSSAPSSDQVFNSAHLYGRG